MVRRWWAGGGESDFLVLDVVEIQHVVCKAGHLVPRRDRWVGEHGNGWWQIVSVHSFHAVAQPQHIPIHPIRLRLGCIGEMGAHQGELVLKLHIPVRVTFEDDRRRDSFPDNVPQGIHVATPTAELAAM